MHLIAREKPTLPPASSTQPVLDPTLLSWKRDNRAHNAVMRRQNNPTLACWQIDSKIPDTRSGRNKKHKIKYNRNRNNNNNNKNNITVLFYNHEEVKKMILTCSNWRARHTWKTKAGWACQLGRESTSTTALGPLWPFLVFTWNLNRLILILAIKNASLDVAPGPTWDRPQCKLIQQADLHAQLR